MTLSSSSKLEKTIDNELRRSMCTMISPNYHYERGNIGELPKKIHWNGNNLAELHDLIGNRMSFLYSKELEKNFEEHGPLININCATKGNDDIMLTIFKEAVKIYPGEDKGALVSDIIFATSAILNRDDERVRYSQGTDCTPDQLFERYSHLLSAKLCDKDDAHKERILGGEANITYEALVECMNRWNQQLYYIFLHNVDSLSVAEQSRINQMLYQRGVMGHDGKRVYLKINNTATGRKTRSTNNGKRIQPVHDYYDLRINEEDIISGM